MLNYGVVDSVVLASQKTLEAASFIVKSMEKLISGAISPDNLGGVVSIVQATSQASNSGIISVLLLGALISVNLGVVNLLPIPALDGGHIIFNLYEMIARRAPSETAFMRLTVAGWVFVGALTFFGLYNDINRIVAAQ
jgi:regulator of sigma E protease